MNDTARIQALPTDQRRGSRPRCLLMTQGTRADVARRLTEIAAPHATVDPDRHHWMPTGFDGPREAKLGEAADLLPDEDDRKRLTEWWLAVPKRANTPNWDIAFTATIDGRPGLVLVEAKAHERELHETGKSLDAKATPNSQANHTQITECIKNACNALNTLSADHQPGDAGATTHPTGDGDDGDDGRWHIRAGSHYQLANRFAWSRKLASMGYPVVLVYLGLLNVEEMSDCGPCFTDADAWDRCIRDHSAGIVPGHIWNNGPLRIGDTPLYPLIVSTNVGLTTFANPPTR